MSIFALIAAVIFFLRAFDISLGSVDLLYLGLGFLALHFAWAWTIPIRRNT